MEFTSEKIDKIIDSMDKRIGLLLKTNGSRIKYWFGVFILILRCLMFMILSFQNSILLVDFLLTKQNSDFVSKTWKYDTNGTTSGGDTYHLGEPLQIAGISKWKQNALSLMNAISS